VHVLPSSHLTVVPAQTLAAQVSPAVHLLRSSQGAVLATLAQPLTLSQLSSVQGFLSSQTTGVPTHTLATQVSLLVQASLSLHAWPTVQPLRHCPALQTRPVPQPVLSATALCLQPATASQLSTEQGLPSSQLTAAPGLQTLPPHASPLVHALLSLQALVLARLTQPLPLSQLSSLQGLPSSQPSLAPLWQALAPHTSPLVHTLLSLQVAVFARLTQPFSTSHASSVQRLPSSQPKAVETAQLPSLHVSPKVQALPSSHGALLLAAVQPSTGSQLSSVHGLPSLQKMFPPGEHAPAWQVSPAVQTVPSSQLPPSLTAVAVHEPAKGTQVFLAHGVSLASEQVTRVAKSTAQVPLPLSQ
jgi:hypothetical protein